MTDNRTDGTAVLYGGPSDGTEVVIELDPDSGQPTTRHRTLTIALPTQLPLTPKPGVDYTPPPDVAYAVDVDKATGVAYLDGQGRFRYIIPGTKL